MGLFTIADLHLSFGTDKPMNIFRGWDDYVEKLTYNWQLKIKEDDTVVLPGDLSWGMNLEESLKDFQYLDKLKGKKIILKGNHDYWWSTKAKMEMFFEKNNLHSLNILSNNHYAYDNIGICGSRGWINEDTIESDKKILLREAGRIELSINSALKEGLRPVVFLHYPPIFGHGVNEDIMSVLIKYNIKHCFYGHIHGKSANKAFVGEKDGINYQLIASDYLQFSPMEITDIVNYYKK